MNNSIFPSEHTAGSVSMQIDVDNSIRSNSVPFEYKPRSCGCNNTWYNISGKWIVSDNI